MLVQCVIASHAEVWSDLVEILSVVDSDLGTGPRQYKVNLMSKIKKVMLTKDTPSSSHLPDYLL